MPMLDALLARLPAPEDVPPVELAVEVDEAFIEALEHATDLVELEQIVVDLPRYVLDARPERELLRRFAPFGTSAGGDDFVPCHQIAPLRVKGYEIGDDAPDQRESTVGFGEGEILSGHGNNIRGRATTRRTDATG